MNDIKWKQNKKPNNNMEIETKWGQQKEFSFISIPTTHISKSVIKNYVLCIQHPKNKERFLCSLCHFSFLMVVMTHNFSLMCIAFP